MRSFSGESTIASGIEPRSYDTPAGSSLTPVGSRRSPDGSCVTTVPSTWVEGDVQALTISAATNSRVNV